MPYIENLDEIKSKLDPEAVLDLVQPGKKVRSGKELRCPCPVHQGDSNNFSINLETHNWQCFSNGCKGTNLVDLYSKTNDVEFTKAAEELANHFGIPVKYRDSKGSAATKKKPTTRKEPQKKETISQEETVQKYKPEDVLKSWKNSLEKGRDTYFSKKLLTPPPIARFGKNPSGYHSTLIPYKNIRGELGFILSLSKDGKFNFKAKDDTKGSFALLGDLEAAEAFYIGEGIATVQTAWEASERKIPAVSCGSWNNMSHVVDAIKEKYPQAQPIVLIDCDEDGNGLKAAESVFLKHPETTFRKPNFEWMSNGYEATDFNDLISKCNQGFEEVKKQLTIEYKMTETITKTLKEEAQGGFFNSLARILDDADFVKKLEGRTYNTFEEEHKKVFSKGGLITGYEEIDDKLCFYKGDLVVVQGMSNHGKSTFKLQLISKFLLEEENQKQNPMCVFVTYESSPLAVETKFINLIGHEKQEGTVILYDRKSEDKYRYPATRDYQQAKMTYNHLLKENRITFLKGIPMEKISALIDIYKKEFPERTLILVLDYIQIIYTELEKEGWEKIKEIAYFLEGLAIKKEILIITGSQVNENRQSREGRDVYNAATTMIDIFNHSHEALKLHKDHQKLYKAKQSNKSICTFSAIKQKNGDIFSLNDYFIFNGFFFEKKLNQEIPKNNKQNSRHGSYMS